MTLGHISNDRGQSLATIVMPDGTLRHLLAIGAKDITGETADAAWQGVATHTDGSTFVSADGVAVLAGLDGTTVTPISVDADGRILIANAPASGTLTDGSGTTHATPSTSSQVFAANTNRKYLFFQNNSDTDMWINLGTAAVASQPSIKIEAGQAFAMESGFVSTQALHVICTGSAKTFTAKEA